VQSNPGGHLGTTTVALSLLLILHS
jgi:hypothetical protein